MMKKSEIELLGEQLTPFIPEKATHLIANVLVEKNVKLTITRKRKTKLGDYRHPYRDIAYHRISINGDLNQYMFLLVLLHELAHLVVWENYKSKVKAHGDEWKQAYRKLYADFSFCFPEEVKLIIMKHFDNLKATTCNDPFLTKHLMHRDKEEVLMLNDLEPGDLFETNGRSFEMINKRRTRYLCKDMMNKRNYLVAGSAIVIRLNK